MARPKHCRRIADLPGATIFEPAGVQGLRITIANPGKLGNPAFWSNPSFWIT